MIPISGDLTTLLSSTNRHLLADLYTLALTTGTTYYFTSLSSDVSWGGHTFVAAGPVIERGRVRSALGLEVAELELTIHYGSGATLGSKTWPRAMLDGDLDGATLTLERAAFSAWASGPVGTVVRFVGTVSTVEPGSVTGRVIVKSGVAKLSMKVPRRTFQAGCTYVLGDAGCGVSLGPLAASHTTASGCTTTSVIAASSSHITNLYKLGSLLFTSGALSGVRVAIAGDVDSGANHVFTVFPPLTSAPAASVTFSVTPGCDRTVATCANTYSNLGRYGGFPWAPTAEQVK